MKNSILKFAFYCLLSFYTTNTLDGIEVKTGPIAADASADRVHYPLFAKRFTDTLLQHPPVADCHVLLQTTAVENFIDRVEIAIQIDRQALVAYLTDQYSARFASARDQERYLDSFSVSIRNSAAEIFTDIRHEAIHVKLSFSE
ncbi:MAG: hypothetical protein LLF94_09675 [Chlamydiales bacterium]|nr:hypothetical protein [Chlamydiales bacterium]